MQQFLDQLIIGLSIGATYALIALGYTMVYGVLRLINFAHGDVYMVGAVIGFYMAQQVTVWQLPLWLGLLLVFLVPMVLCAILGFIIEYFAYRPLRSQPRLVSLITAIGVSLLLENLAQLNGIFGANPRSYPPLIPKHVITIHLFSVTATIRSFDLLRLGVCVLLMAALTWMVLKTRTGLALRALSFRFDTARLMGINTNRVISYTFMFGSALAAVAGVLDGMDYNVTPLMGIIPGLKAFIAAVLGGIGSIPGALVGGLIIGVVETFLNAALPQGYTGYSNAFAFVVLILILLVRPTGLFGRPAAEKV